MPPLQDEAGVIRRVTCQDALAGETFDVDAKIFINATGPFCDALRKLATDGAAPPLITPSSGVHITLPARFGAHEHGLIVPKTKDGRVVFLLPWLGTAVAGTTDAPTTLTTTPRPTTAEVDFILETLSDYLAAKPRRQDVLSAWSGIRPLAADASKGATENITRDHVLVADAGMLTITGGKWTTYRKVSAHAHSVPQRSAPHAARAQMAEDAVDLAVSAAGLHAAGPCVTRGMGLTGAAGWHPDLPSDVLRAAADMRLPAVDTQVAAHLAHAYGNRAHAVLRLAAQQRRLGGRLVDGWPVMEVEVIYCARAEFCATAIDFLARRSRLAFLDVVAARKVHHCCPLLRRHAALSDAAHHVAGPAACRAAAG